MWTGGSPACRQRLMSWARCGATRGAKGKGRPCGRLAFKRKSVERESRKGARLEERDEGRSFRRRGR